MARRDASKLQFEALQIEGALIQPDVVAKVAAGDAWQQTDESYGVLPGLKLRDEIGRFYLVGRTLWQRFDTGRSAEKADAACKAFARDILAKVLGFHVDGAQRGIAGAGFELFMAKGGHAPIVITGAQGLDKAETIAVGGGNTIRRSPTTALQGELNGNEKCLWGLATDGMHLRILRDNASLTRPALIEFDIDRIFRNDLYADFAVFWLLAHESRFGGADAPPSECALEVWRNQGREEGITARGRLRDGVEMALFELGNGFLEHPENTELRERLRGDNGKTLSKEAYFRQLLRLVYRLIFVMTVEDRDVLFAPDATEAAKAAYRSGYSLSRLRDRSRLRSAWDRHHDGFEAVKVVIGVLAEGDKRLGLPALGGLFDPKLTPDLQNAKIANKRFFAGLFQLGWLREKAGLVRINWRDMETEEFGSVYESLLELVPTFKDGCGKFYFLNGLGDDVDAGAGAVSGNQRKITSSYYTKDALVEFLLSSALDPVIEKTIAENPGNPDALLRISVLDGACGSGHFILAAARRIAERLADLRNPGSASLGDFRHALREAVAHCIYGVDRNELAAELCRVALWIEAVEPGKPLTFLDSKIRHGDSLIGVSDFGQLAKGIPDEAYAALDWDDKPTASYYRSLNKAQRDGGKNGRNQERFEFSTAPVQLAEAARLLDQMPDDNVEQIGQKVAVLASLHSGEEWTRLKSACDLWISAFFMDKTGGAPKSPELAAMPTTDHVWLCLRGVPIKKEILEKAQASASKAQAFHWPLMFPDVFAQGGFDVVLGNPPWKPMSPDMKEFFAPYDPEIRFLSPTDQRTRVEQLKSAPGVAAAWDAYCQALYLAARFMKESGRYTLFAEGNLGKGDFNVYRMFVELALKATKAGGRAAQFVPENLYNGANATAIREHLFASTKLERLVGFENTKHVWFDIDTRAKFCMYVANPGGTTNDFAAGFGINSLAKLQRLASGLPFTIPLDLVREFSPDALAISEVVHQSDIDISRKIYAGYPKFGAGWNDPHFRPYAREMDMGNDRETFASDPEGLPVYEGRMVEAYDHRAKAYVSGRGRKAIWRDLPFGTEKKIVPQWRIGTGDVPNKIGDRWLRARAGFCDVASPTNQRAFVAALIPPRMICGDKVPTVLLENVDPRALLLWVGVANSFAIDFVVRKKVALKMSFTLVDSLPLPKTFTGTPAELEIAKRVLQLSATGPELADFWEENAPQVGLSATDHPLELADDRRKAQTEIDVLVARDLFDLTKSEMNFLLDPSDTLGADCGYETFGALKRAEMQEYGAFATKEQILKAWDSLDLSQPATETALPAKTGEPRAIRPPAIEISKLPVHAWALPVGSNQSLVATAQLAALIKRLPGPAPIRIVRLAALCALEPKYLMRHLSAADTAIWRRLIGPEAEPSRGKNNIAAFAPRMDANWRKATSQLLGMKCILEDISGQTWAPGTSLDKFETQGWPDGRAWFVLEALKKISVDQITANLPAEDRGWIDVRAA
jgi:hypothetical protein